MALPKQAMRKLVRGPDGMMHVVFIDMTTGQEVQSINGYTIVEPNNGSTDGLNLGSGIGSPTTNTNPEPAKPDPVADSVADDIIRQSLNQGKGGESAVYGIINNYERTAANNYGFLDKPAWSKIANSLPGFLGLSGKVVNGMVNHSNIVAADKARSVLGLEPVGPKETAKGVLGQSDYSEGLIANVNIDGKNYAVGFTARTPDGRTTLTPEEARKRGITSKTGLKEVSAEEAAQDAEAVNKEFPGQEEKGFLGTAVDSLKKGLGIKDDTPAKRGGGLADVVGRNAGNYTPAGTVGAQTAESVRKAAEAGLAASGGVRGSSFDFTPSTPQYDNEANYGYNYAKDKSQINSGLTGVVDSVAHEVDHPVNVSSGYRSPAYNASIGGARQSMHTQGRALDMSTKGLSDAEKRDLVNRTVREGRTTFGEGNFRIGTYPDQSLHIDNMKHVTQDYGGVHSMYNRSNQFMDQAPSWFKEGLFDSTVPVPTVLDREQNPAIATAAPAMKGFLGDQGPKMAATAATMLGDNRLESLKGKNLLDASPSVLAASGYGTRKSDAEIDAIAYTMAGELDPKQLAGLMEGNPEAIQEVNNMMATIENRAKSTQNANTPNGYAATLTPSTYNSIGLPNTEQNYRQYGDVLKNTLRSIEDGQAGMPQGPNLTHYANLDISNPDWRGLGNATYNIGGHTYMNDVTLEDGSQVQYRPSAAFEEQRERTIMGPYASDMMNYQMRTDRNRPNYESMRDYTQPDFGYKERATWGGSDSPRSSISSPSKTSNGERGSSALNKSNSKNNSYDFGGLVGGTESKKPASGNSASKTSKSTSKSSDRNSTSNASKSSSKSSASKSSSKSNVGAQNTPGASNRGSIGGGYKSSKPASGNTASKSSSKSSGGTTNSSGKSSKGLGGESNSKSSGTGKSSDSASKGKK